MQKNSIQAIKINITKPGKSHLKKNYKNQCLDKIAYDLS